MTQLKITQLIERVIAFAAKVEEYMAEGDAYDDAFDRAYEDCGLPYSVLTKMLDQLEDWPAIQNGIVVTSADSIQKLMKIMPQVNVYYLVTPSTSTLSDSSILLKNGFTKVEPVEIPRETHRGEVYVDGLKFERV